MKKALLSPAFCSSNGIVVLYHDDKTAAFGMLHMEDEVLKIRIKKAYQKKICIFSPVLTDEFNLRLSQIYSEEINEESFIKEHDLDKGYISESSIDRITGDAPIINLLNSIFLEAISRKASDIHIESGKEYTEIRFRIDGILVPIKNIATERSMAVSSRLKLLANLNVLETRRPQDGHIDIVSESYSLDVRISITPTIWGESIVLRLLNRSDIPLSIDSLGFSKSQRERIDTILSISSGLILVTGPTGSGKTTTLAALLMQYNKSKIKIISIEDPVEYRIEGVTQIQVNEDLGLSFDMLLRRVFRQDPDIIMVGEIRDLETAELAIRAALTGHLVFATLHTNNALESIYRLQNMGIPYYMIAAVLRAVIAQRLMRKKCTNCGGSGCGLCNSAGYSGRTVIAEILLITSKITELIRQGISSEDFHKTLREENFQTLLDSAELKIKEGISTAEELRRELGVVL